MSFHLNSLEELRDALVDLRARGVKLEDPGDEIGRRRPARRTWRCGFTIRRLPLELSVQNAARGLAGKRAEMRTAKRER